MTQGSQLIVSDTGSVYTWNGASWSNLGSGSPGNAVILQFGNLLISGGGNTIRSWDGTSWATIGSHPGYSTIDAMTFEGYLFVGGNFQPSASWPCGLVAKFDGTTWSCNDGPLGPAVDEHYNYVLAFGLHGGSLYAAGYLGIGQNIYSLSSPTGIWMRQAATAGGDVQFLQEFRGRLYLGAWSTGALYVLDDASNTLSVVGGSGLSGGRLATCAVELSGVLYIGGDFLSISSSGESASRAVSWG
jgi:hypothetical protein